ncbi:MAG: 2'-5' RNA ligase family protein [Planctomycetaceae bacterium]
MTAVSGSPPFSVELRGIGGALPVQIVRRLSGPDCPRRELSDLQVRVESLASEFGYAPEIRPFHPHVTLARVKHRPPPALQQLLSEHAATEWGHCEVASVELFQSTLTPGGSQYKVLSHASLNR